MRAATTAVSSILEELKQALIYCDCIVDSNGLPQWACRAGTAEAESCAARLLESARAEGEEISRLILLDSVAPSLMQLPAPKDDATDLLEACATAASLYDIKVEIDFHRIKELSTEAALKYIVGLLHEGGVDINDTQLAAFYRVYRANLTCYRNYKPSMLPRNIDVALYVATQADGAATPLHRGWNELLHSPVQIYTVDADHFSLLSKVQFANLADAFVA
jgi:thioesterase domain-containing protein